MEGEWFDGHLYMKIKPQQQGHKNDNNIMTKQPPERKMRRRASESDLPSLTLSPIMEHSRCSDDDVDDDKTIKARKPKRRARRVTTDDSTGIDRKKLSRSWTAGCNYDYDPLPVPDLPKISKHPSIVHLDPIYCVPTSDSCVNNTPTLTQKKSRFQEIKEPDPVEEEEKDAPFCREVVSPFQEVKDPPADHSFCQPCV